MKTRLMLLTSAMLAGLTLFGATGALAQGVPLFAVLNGGNECNGATPPLCRQGDLDAFGSATVIFPKANQVCWAILADNLTGATAAHIHRGVAGVNGGIVVTLTPPSAPGAGNPGGSSGCVAAGSGIISAIKAAPTAFYINAHNGRFPNGAIRGQLF